MSYLIHDVVGMFEEAKYAVVEFDAHIVFILLQTERAEIKVFEPVIVDLSCYGCLSYCKCTSSSDYMILQS